MENRKKIYVLLAGSVAWAVIIFVFCAMPSDSIPRVRIPGMDKIFHFGVFFVQSVLLSLMFNFQAGNRYFRIILLSTLLAFAYGGLIEILQSKFFNRTGDLYDLMADIAGGFAGAMAYPAILKLYGLIFRKNR
jgi:VanZ family protein